MSSLAFLPRDGRTVQIQKYVLILWFWGHEMVPESRGMTFIAAAVLYEKLSNGFVESEDDFCD